MVQDRTMTSQKIESYFDTAENNKEETENCTKQQKRIRSEGSSEGGDSPAFKKGIFDEDASLLLPEDAPFWVPTLFKCIDKLNATIHVMSVKFDTFKTDVERKLIDIKVTTEEKIKSLNVSLDNTVVEQKKEIQELTESVKFISSAYDEQKATNDDLLARMQTLEQHHDQIKNKCHAYEDEFIEQSSKIDALEQYGRRNCVLLHGIPETKDEITDSIFVDTIKTHLDITVKSRELDRTHRLGEKKEGKIRPIIGKFARYNKRKEVFQNKKKFKGSTVMLTESLTRRMVIMLNAAKDKFGKDNVWTIDGEIFTKKDGKIVNVRYL